MSAWSPPRPSPPPSRRRWARRPRSARSRTPPPRRRPNRRPRRRRGATASSRRRASPRRGPPRQARQGTAGTGERTRRPGLGDLDPRSFGRDARLALEPPAGGGDERPGGGRHRLGDHPPGPALRRPPGRSRARRQPDRDHFVPSPQSRRLARGAAAGGAPSGLTTTIAAMPIAVADLALASFVGCSPLRGLPGELVRRAARLEQFHHELSFARMRMRSVHIFRIIAACQASPAAAASLAQTPTVAPPPPTEDDGRSSSMSPAAAARRCRSRSPTCRRPARRAPRPAAPARSAARSPRSSPPISGIRACSRRSGRAAFAPSPSRRSPRPISPISRRTGAQNLVQGFVQANRNGSDHRRLLSLRRRRADRAARQGYRRPAARLAPRRAPLRRHHLLAADRRGRLFRHADRLRLGDRPGAAADQAAGDHGL